MEVKGIVYEETGWIRERAGCNCFAELAIPMAVTGATRIRAQSKGRANTGNV